MPRRHSSGTHDTLLGDALNCFYNRAHFGDGALDGWARFLNFSVPEFFFAKRPAKVAVVLMAESLLTSHEPDSGPAEKRIKCHLVNAGAPTR